MKLYAHQFGNHRLRCQFEDSDTARALWDQFVPMVLQHVFDIKGFGPDTALPVINGQGFWFRNQLLTAFGEKFDVVVVDSNGVKEIASKVKSDSTPS